jgi:tRNA A37 threonylcarbamoyladenosine synthetase subunit TsaC/SUA5/YrdC
VTSANLSGEAPALTAEAAGRALGGAVAVVLDAGPVRGGVPSTVARLRDGFPEVIRRGALSREQLNEVLRHG